MNCNDCRKDIPPTGGTGYGKTPDGKTICYACCGERDRKDLGETGRGMLYLAETGGKLELTNWPGTFRIKVDSSSRGRHNWAGSRTDVWFRFGGREWHGVQYGENSQVCRVRRLVG